MTATGVRIEPWGEGDLPLLEKLLGDPQMTQYLGGPESPEQLARRQARYAQLAEGGGDRMFKIIDEETGEAVGSAGFWSREWRGEQVYEVGWFVLPAFQGRGIAVQATAQVIAVLKEEAKHRFVHAFPSVDNAPSNAICRRLGFSLLADVDFEYPPGRLMLCNDWGLRLGE